MRTLHCLNTKAAKEKVGVEGAGSRNICWRKKRQQHHILLPQFHRFFFKKIAFILLQEEDTGGIKISQTTEHLFFL